MLESLFVIGLFSLLVVLGAASISITKSVQGLVSAQESVTLTDSSGATANPSVPKAQAGTLTTHTTNSTGTLTMASGTHGIITGQRIDIYWTGGKCYGAIAGTVSGTTVPIASVSGGDNLPASSTPVTVGIPVSSPFSFTGDNLTALVYGTGVGGYFVLNNGSADVAAEYVTAGRTGGWKTGDSDANPTAGAVPTKIWMSQNSTTAAVTSMQAGAISH